MLFKKVKTKEFNCNVEDLRDMAIGGEQEPFKGISRCTDGDFIWDEDLVKFVPVTKDSLQHYQWKNSQYIIPIPLRLNMTSVELMEICLEAGQRPIRHQICQCLDGDFIWDEYTYSYKPYTVAQQAM